jgi:predicted AlkP superfamily pyrophosphatase or phosphodiesterase
MSFLMLNRLFFRVVSCLAVLSLLSESHAADAPRLVVVVSVDQLSQEYLIRFADNFADDGAFRRVQQAGAYYTQCHHRHAYTITAPGHSVQLTGAYPNTNGIVANTWFDRTTGKDRYCAADESVQVVGVPKGTGMSPRQLLVETVGDVMKLDSRNKSKVFGVAIKDRAAILMTGHNSDAAFWMQDDLWVTSTYYRKDLPGYLRVINEGQSLKRYAGQAWTLSLPLERYHNSGPDKNDWENPPKGMTGDFPHRVAEVGQVAPDVFGDQVLFSPLGNEVTLEAAREIITHEQLGQDEFPDLLCINFSSNDYVGHAFGPHSLEVEDLTYQTDRQLGQFLDFLDQHVGKGKWTFAVTADHGVAPIVEYAVQFRIPAKRNPLGPIKDVQAKLEKMLREDLKAGPEAAPLIQKLDEIQVYLNRNHPLLAGGNLVLAQRRVRDWLLNQPHVAASATGDELAAGGAGKFHDQLRRAFHPRRSGDVLTIFDPFCVPGTRGTTHGSPWHYDTNVPMLLLGAGIKNGKHDRPVSPACLASTVAELVQVKYPSGNVEEPLREALGR